MITSADWKRLCDAASDREIDTLQDIALRAGVLWTCGICSALSEETEGKCCNCEAPKDETPCDHGEYWKRCRTCQAEERGDALRDMQKGDRDAP